jgi:hypothetical protein
VAVRKSLILILLVTFVGACSGTESGVGSCSGERCSAADGGLGAVDAGPGDGDGGSGGSDAGQTGSDAGVNPDAGGGGMTPVCDGTGLCTGAPIWGERFGNSAADNSSSEYINASATDPGGYTFIAGRIDGSLDFGGGTVFTGPTAGFIAKLDPSGNVVWAEEFRGQNALEVHSIALDSDGNVSIAGAVRGDMIVDGGQILDGDSSSWDAFLLSYAGDGSYRFGNLYGSDGDSDSAGGVAVSSSSGRIALIGHFGDRIDFGGNLLNSTQSSTDVFVAVFSQDGQHLWSRRFGDGLGQYGDSVAFDLSDNVMVAARVYGTIDFGGQPLTSEGGGALAIAKLSAAAGDRMWSHLYDDTNNTTGIARLTSEPNQGHLYLGTYNPSASQHTMDFGLGDVSGAFFVAKFDQSTGDVVWNHGFGGSRGIRAMVCDQANSLVVAGSFQFDVDFGGGTRNSFGGSYDVFAAKFDRASGQYRWDQTIGDYNQQNRTQQGTGVGVDASGNVYLAGYFDGEINPGTGILTSGMGLGGSDGFVVKLEP